MASDEEACAVCGNDRGLKKNPIIFCDGQDCNLPVHQKCYHVSVIPDDQWFCERCEVKQKGIEPKVICCPSTDGALKKTTQGDFIHVVCALWNDAIRENDLPYSVPERLLNVKVCDICSKKTGLCVECERPKCTNRYHVTCAIKAGYIEPEPTMPAQYIFECPTHQPVRPARARGKPRRKAQQDENEDMETEDDSPNEKQSNDDDDDEGDSDEEASSDDQQESDDSDEMGLTPRKRSRNKLAALAKKRRGNDGKTRGNLQQLLLQDQSDSDDNMGSRHSSSSNSTTSSTRKPNKPNGPKPMDVDKSSSAKKEPNGHTNLSIGPASQRERFEAKRMKVDMKKTNTTPPSSPSLLNAKATPPATNQPSATAVPAVPAMPAVPALPTMPTVPPPGAPHPALALDLNKQPHTNKDTINTSVSSVLPNGAKQKLPNKSHLAPSMPKVLNGNPPSRPPASAIRKPSSSNIKDLNEIQNEMNANAQRWGMDRKNSQPT
ncbi:hypothetical protein DM01DRAFT_1338110 [Hesseltinella vesiculosa]|uniref:PHD-type domain-containing protein n=1 Tax=Hesseltinella vesiculosa TaxID=101127 RepID=A0A1X2GAV7_9FUNG|nr:hypothetical protein DM01DRAFT_1338110 [Hesseltinella vesiculosa]